MNTPKLSQKELALLTNKEFISLTKPRSFVRRSVLKVLDGSTPYDDSDFGKIFGDHADQAREVLSGKKALPQEVIAQMTRRESSSIYKIAETLQRLIGRYGAHQESPTHLYLTDDGAKVAPLATQGKLGDTLEIQEVNTSKIVVPKGGQEELVAICKKRISMQKILQRLASGYRFTLAQLRRELSQRGVSSSSVNNNVAKLFDLGVLQGDINGEFSATDETRQLGIRIRKSEF